ncbi:MAG: endonuclease VIII [Dysgonomonas sp.]|nr:endonuclease VIII [Dysgonomonas sp.]
MLEIPELCLLNSQIQDFIVGKTIVEVVDATSPHQFAWFHGDPKKYSKLLTGRRVESSSHFGMFLNIHFDKDTFLSTSDGAIPRLYSPHEKHPKKHQLLLVFDDASFLAYSVSMYGFLLAHKDDVENPYYLKSKKSISPLDDAFDRQFFEDIFHNATKDYFIKALMATEQRIPGLGNGTLQDILFNAGIHPKRKISTLSEADRDRLFNSMKSTLQNMTDKNGRNTQKDLFGKKGQYACILSSKTYKDGCPLCGDEIIKESFMGGSIYYCPHCQKL